MLLPCLLLFFLPFTGFAVRAALLACALNPVFA